MIISSGQKLQSLNDYTIKIYKDGVQLNETTHSKFIGLTDDNLSWKAHQHDISKKPPNSPKTLVGLSESSHLFLCTLKLSYAKVLLNHALITVKRSEVACATVVLTHGTIFPRNVRTHSKFSKSDDFEGKLTLGLLIMLPHGNHEKQLLELIHFLLLYENFNRV